MNRHTGTRVSDLEDTVSTRGRHSITVPLRSNSHLLLFPRLTPGGSSVCVCVCMVVVVVVGGVTLWVGAHLGSMKEFPLGRSRLFCTTCWWISCSATWGSGANVNQRGHDTNGMKKYSYCTRSQIYFFCKFLNKINLTVKHLLVKLKWCEITF